MDYLQLSAQTAQRQHAAKPKQGRSNEEHLIQSALVQRCKMSESVYPQLKLLFAIPNGAYLGLQYNDRTGEWYCPQGQKLKREGLKPGVWDLFLSVPSGGWHGLYLETKSAKGRLTEEQATFCELASDYDYLCRVYRDAEQGWNLIMAYLSGKPPLRGANRLRFLEDRGLLLE